MVFLASSVGLTSEWIGDHVFDLEGLVGAVGTLIMDDTEPIEGVAFTVDGKIDVIVAVVDSRQGSKEVDAKGVTVAAGQAFWVSRH